MIIEEFTEYMTIEEFTEYWNLDRSWAQSYLAQRGCKKSEKKNDHDEEKIKLTHEWRVKAFAPKEDNELDRHDIFEQYSKLAGQNVLITFMQGKNNFPKPKRKMLTDKRSRKLWDKAEVEYFFNHVFVPYKKNEHAHVYVEPKKKPAKPRKLKQPFADSVWFITGRQWRIGEPIYTTFNHTFDF